jgi:hypothetical protein
MQQVRRPQNLNQMRGERERLMFAVVEWDAFALGENVRFECA